MHGSNPYIRTISGPYFPDNPYIAMLDIKRTIEKIGVRLDEKNEVK